MATKEQISLYRIDIESIITVSEEEKNKEEIITNYQGVKYIVDRVPKSRRPKPLDIVESLKTHFEPYTIELFFCKVPVDFRWQNFFAEHLTDSESNKEFKTFRESKHASFLCFIYDEEDIFAFSGGLGNAYIKDFVDDEFGIQSLEKIGNPQTLELRMSRDNVIVGNRAMTEERYREDQKANSKGKLGKVCNGVVSNVPYEKIFSEVKDIIFSGDEKSKMNIEAKASFKFSKALCLHELKLVVDFLKSLPSEQSISFSLLKSLSNRRMHEKVKIKKLKIKLCIEMYNIISSLVAEKQATSNKLFEISHVDYQNFYKSDRISVSRRGLSKVVVFESPYGLDTLYVLQQIVENDKAFLKEKIKKIKKVATSKKESDILKLIAAYSIKCYSLEGGDNPTIDKKLVDYITAEIEEQGKPHFLINKKWYYSEEDYLSELNKEFEAVYSESVFEFPIDMKWGELITDNKIKETENTYLAEMVKKRPECTIVFHKVIPYEYKIELCDVMFWDDENVYLIHIKPSFDGAVRVLEKQIIHSANLVAEDLRTGDIKKLNHLKRYFKEAKEYKKDDEYRKGIKSSLSKIKEKDFYQLFKDKKINYVACIVDPKSRRSLSVIKDFKSNVAKMSTIEASRTIRSNAHYNSRFRISEITIADSYQDPIKD